MKGEHTNKRKQSNIGTAYFRRLPDSGMQMNNGRLLTEEGYQALIF